MPSKTVREVKKLKKAVKTIKQDIGVPETKSIYAESATPVQLSSNTNAMTQTLLTNISQGDGASQRTGDSVTLKGLDVRIMYSYQNVQPNFLRFLLVRFNGLYRDIAVNNAENNVVNNYNETNARYSNAISQINGDYCRMPKWYKDSKQNEITILWDKLVPFFPSQTDDNGYAFNGKCGVVTYKKVFKKKHIVKFNDNNQATGHVALLILGGASTTAGDNPQCGWSSMMTYQDV